MDTQELQRCLPPDGVHTRVSGNRLSLRFRVYSLDQVLQHIDERGSQTRTCEVIIFNCCPASRPGIHWMVLVLEKNTYQFFDPFAQDVRLYSPLLADTLRPLVCIWKN